MRVRALVILAVAAAAAVVLLLPGEAKVSAPALTEVSADPPANHIDAATGVATATSAQRFADRLIGSGDLASFSANVVSARAQALADERARAPGSLEEEVVALSAMLGRDVDPADLEAARAADPEVAAATARLLAAIRVAAELREEAFAGLTQAERAELATAADEALDAAGDRHRAEVDRQAALARFDALAQDVDLEKLSAAGLVVTDAVDAILSGSMGANGASGDVALTLLGGLVHVGGQSPTYYDTFNILVLDLGGDDEYTDTAGGVGPGSPFPVSVVVDLAGNDRYNPGTGASYSAQHVQGAGFFGIGVLVDVAGDDQYSSVMSISATGDVAYTLERSQGFGALGVGILADLGGSDLYASSIRLDARDGRATYFTNLVQGAASHGVGLLLDANGVDSYSSSNALTIDVEKGKAFSTWTAQHCQGSVLTAGVGILADGILPESARLNSRIIRPTDAIGLQSDSYNSWNRIMTTLATTEAGFTGTTDGLALLFNLHCQGATYKGFDFNITNLPVAVSLGALVDVYGDDAFASGNYVRTVGVNRGGVEDSCAACHLGASVVVRDSQGAASAMGGAFGGEGAVAGGHAGVMVDVLGDDAYNSYNSMIVDGIRFAGRPGQTNAIAEYEVNRSIGHAGVLAVSRGEPKAAACAGQGTPTGIAATPCAPPACSPGGRTPVGGIVTDPGPPGACFVGVHVDLEGDDVYNSDNFLTAREADTNFELVNVERSLGVGEMGGIGVHVDGPLGGDAVLTEGSFCSSRLGCTAPIRVALDDQSGGNDRVNVRNIAHGARVFRLVDNLGNGLSGYGAAIDVSPGATLALDASGNLDIPAIAGNVNFATFTSDLYDSDNEAPIPIDVRNSFGHADDGIGAFVEVGGWDVYDQNPASPPSDAWNSFGYIEGNVGVALHADVGGFDRYPSVMPPPAPLLIFAPGPADDAGWDYGTSLIRIGWGLDALSMLT